MGKGDRRMEAENYLGSGFGIRLAIESQSAGWVRFDVLGRVYQPGRLKGILVSPAFGAPYLGATQVFDLRPAARRWLALERTAAASDLQVKSGTILVTRSGSVGRATMGTPTMERYIVSDDLLRVHPHDDEWWGWLYAYLRAAQTREMMKAAHYGHIIKHLEVGHLNSLPVPKVRKAVRESFRQHVQKILDDRARSVELTAQAERLYEEALPSANKGPDVLGFAVSARRMFDSRRRLDAARFAPSVDQVIQAFRKDARELVPVSAVTKKVFVPGRFKHVYGQGGTPYLDSADILEVNPDIKKFVLSLSPEEQEDYRVEPGWLLIPCSGQVYGNIGHSVLATQWHVGKVLTNHIMRICPADNIRPGYLLCSLGHPRLGRPQLVRLAFGSSVPEIAPEDVASAMVPRLSTKTEDRIADLMEEAAQARDEADELEEQIAREAEHLIDRFLAGDREAIEQSGP